MLTSRIIPCLDVRDGRVVKGVRFQGLRDAGCPVELAREYEAQGADELVFLDVSATPEGRSTHRHTVSKVRAELSIPLTTGGGVRKADDAALLLEAGADKVGVNTAAVSNPQLISDIAVRFGSQCAVVAIDAAHRLNDEGHTASDRWEVVTQSGKNRTGMSAIDWARQAVERGAGEILLTSWDRDGTRSGYDLELLTAISNVVNVPIIASGGANEPTHLADALRAGAGAVLAASIFHEGDYTVGQIKQFLHQEKFAIRL
jgi:imidazoleglycerol phosphate synthase cyclase subunit